MLGVNEHRSPVVATVVAGSLMLIFGLTYRALSAYLGAPVVSRTPMNSAVLDKFPSEFRGWTGQDVPIDPAIVLKTGTDAHINRQYSRRNGLESVCLYLACGAQARTVVSHRPDQCYSGAGWKENEKESRKIDVHLSDGKILPCIVFVFERDGLNTRRMAVLNYFILGGEIYRDYKAVESKAGRRLGMVDYAAQVQICSTNTLSSNAAAELAIDFARDSTPLIIGLFKDIDKQRNSIQSSTALEEK